MDEEWSALDTQRRERLLLLLDPLGGGLQGQPQTGLERTGRALEEWGSAHDD